MVQAHRDAVAAPAPSARELDESERPHETPESGGQQDPHDRVEEANHRGGWSRVADDCRHAPGFASTICLTTHSTLAKLKSMESRHKRDDQAHS